MQCPTTELAAYLDDSLDSSLHDSLLAHLDQCESCRNQIEQQAGTDRDWELAQRSLATCKLDSDGNILPEHSLAQSLIHQQTTAPLAFMPPLAPTDDPQSAGRLGSFEVTGIIGSGGMGLVLKARELSLDRWVAIKLLAPHLARSQSARKRFAREARAAAAVIHDNVIAIYQVAEWNELPYLVMPYLPDPTLQQRIDDAGSLDLESTLSIGMQVARGLAAAHAQGLVHRDIKPANILLAKGTERAIITDFGLARAADDATLTRIGLLAGTPHYMSPEQARGEIVDQKSDLFSLGSLLFAMIAGRPPIANELGSETIQRIAKGSVPSLQSQSVNAPQWLAKLVDWLHQPIPANRPESAAQVALLLEQCLAYQRQPDTQPLPACLLTNHASLRKRRIALLGAALVALVAISFPAWRALRPSSPAKTNPSVGLKNDAAARDAPWIDIIELPTLQPPPSIQLAPIPDWFGNDNLIDRAAERSKSLQASLEETWSIKPAEGPPHDPSN